MVKGGVAEHIGFFGGEVRWVHVGFMITPPILGIPVSVVPGPWGSSFFLLFSPQYESCHKMGGRRTSSLHPPQKRVLWGVCWQFFVLALEADATHVLTSPPIPSASYRTPPLPQGPPRNSKTSITIVSHLRVAFGVGCRVTSGPYSSRLLSCRLLFHPHLHCHDQIKQVRVMRGHQREEGRGGEGGCHGLAA